MDDENLRLRAALRDLVALSTIPAGWIGIEPRTIASGLADILTGSLDFAFAFVRLRDLAGAVAIDVTSGSVTREFLHWLEAQLSTLDESLRDQIPSIDGLDDGPRSLRGIVIPIGFHAHAGLVAVGCERSDFPTQTDRMLLTVAANHAATAFRSANLIHERRRAEEEARKARDELEMKVMERTAELHRTMAELTHMNRVATAGVLSASIAHELNQPLAAIFTNTEVAEILLKSPSPDMDEIKEILAHIKRDDQRASEVIKRLRSLLTRAKTVNEEFDLNDTIREVLGFLSGQASSRGVALQSALSPHAIRVKGDRIQLQQVILNLVVNGMDAMADAGTRERKVTSSTVVVDGAAEVAITDCGPGIASDKLPHLFEPFFTTKQHGMGMGLCIARTIIEAHGGRIWAETETGGGAIFRLSLPLAKAH